MRLKITGLPDSPFKAVPNQILTISASALILPVIQHRDVTALVANEALPIRGGSHYPEGCAWAFHAVGTTHDEAH
jgi:hypothetical protein